MRSLLKLRKGTSSLQVSAHPHAVPDAVAAADDARRAPDLHARLALHQRPAVHERSLANQYLKFVPSFCWGNRLHILPSFYSPDLKRRGYRWESNNLPNLILLRFSRNHLPFMLRRTFIITFFICTTILNLWAEPIPPLSGQKRLDVFFL